MTGTSNLKKNKNSSVGISPLVVLLLGFLTMGMVIASSWDQLTQPFWGHHEFNGVFYGTIARNYHRYGLLQTKGAQVTTGFETSAENWGYHTHHPATYPLLLYLWTLIMPFTELSMRSVSVLATTTTILYWLWVNRRQSATFLGAVMSVILLLMTPLLRYYFSLPVFEPLMLPLMLIGAMAYQKRQSRLLIWMIFLSALLDWPGYWLGIWVSIISLVKKDWRLVKLACLSLLGVTGVILFHQWLAYGNPLTEIIEIGQKRLDVTAQPYTLYQWLRLLISRTKSFLGLPVLVASFIGSLIMIRSRQKPLFVLLLGIGLSHILVFRNITWYHDYMLYHLLPLLLFTSLTFFKWLQQKSNLFAMSILSVFLILELATTSRFYTDLAKMQPHKVCVEFGQQVAKTDSVLTFVGTQEKLNSCPPFIGFYGQKRFNKTLITE